MEEKDVQQQFHSSFRQMEDFIKFSPVWKDMKEELMAWLGNAHMLLENPDCNLDHQRIDQLSGRARTIREVLNIPEVLLEAMKLKKH